MQGSPFGWGRLVLVVDPEGPISAGRLVLVVDPEGPISAGRRRALGVTNSRGDSRPGGGCVEEGAGGLASSRWVSMVSGSDEGTWRAADQGGWRGAAGAAASASGASGALWGVRIGRAVQSL